MAALCLPSSAVALCPHVKSNSELLASSPQTWIAQILHETGEDANDGDETNLSSDVLLDGRVLCRVANAIAPGTVEVILQEKSMNVRARLAAREMCRSILQSGVPFLEMFNY